MPVAPRPRQLGQMALRAAQAAPVGGGAADSAPAEGAPAGGDTKPGKGTRALAVGIGVVLVLSLVLTLFFALWDFSEPTGETDATAQPAAEAEAQPPDTVG
ncbi:MAG: hypothetical protein HKN73_19600 [Gemmatimonadetes bacterium]|nr:hypothetical protein [Gemmatimonadota bacterium]